MMSTLSPSVLCFVPPLVLHLGCSVLFWGFSDVVFNVFLLAHVSIIFWWCILMGDGELCIFTPGWLHWSQIFEISDQHESCAVHTTQVSLGICHRFRMSSFNPDIPMRTWWLLLHYSSTQDSFHIIPPPAPAFSHSLVTFPRASFIFFYTYSLPHYSPSTILSSSSFSG